jgi:DNA-binding transcriptional ArsR family regulator
MSENLDYRLDGVFHALSHRARREIINLISDKPLTIGELVPRFDMSFEAVSKHVRVLEQAGILQREIRGRTHVCHLNSGAMKQAIDWLDSYQKFWETRLDKLEKLLG